MSRTALQAALARRGVSRRLVEEEIRRYERSDPDCFDRALRAALSTMSDHAECDKTVLVRRLVRRGFSSEDVKKLFA